MSGSAPSNPASGDHAHSFEQTQLDGGQNGQAQNIIDETSSSFGRTTVDRDVGQTIDAGNGRGGTSSRVDELLDGTSTMTKKSTSAERKGSEIDMEGFRVGEEADLHDLAGRKQP